MRNAAVLGLAAAIAAFASAAVAKLTPRQGPRVCCRAVLPAKGDTMRLAVICADMHPQDSLGVVRVTRAYVPVPRP